MWLKGCSFELPVCQDTGIEATAMAIAGASKNALENGEPKHDRTEAAGDRIKTEWDGWKYDCQQVSMSFAWGSWKESF